MINTVFLREFSQLLLKNGATIEDLLGMTYTQEELDPQTGKYKKYFGLTVIKRDPAKYPDGFTYKIRYKIDLKGVKITQGKATYTTKTAVLEEAIKLGFDNRLETLRNYSPDGKRLVKGRAFFDNLRSYYNDGSASLKDDTSANKREVVHKSRKEAKSFIENDLIPYLTEKKINNIQDITIPIYNGLKVYLQDKGIKDKTINNRLNYFTRILENYHRNGLLEKLPYTKGTATLKLTGKQEKEDAEVLPIEKLKSIYPHISLIDPIKLINFMNPQGTPLTNDKLSVKERKLIFNIYTLPFTLSILALNTGMRNSEVARIKREDFISVKEKKIFLLLVWNKKTDYFNKTSESKYRKIPLHPFTVEAIKIFINQKEELYGIINDIDFIFGNPVKDKDTGKIDGFLPFKVFDRTVLFFLKLIKHKGNFPAFFTNEKELIKVLQDKKSLYKELEEIKNTGKGISFYSFRKTFRTMLGLKNDLAEYYMGHKLGSDAKTTYIQVNSLDNNLFVEEYAQPVINMLDKYVFITADELKELADKENNKINERNKFFGYSHLLGNSFQDTIIRYMLYENFQEDKNPKPSETDVYFGRM